MAIALLIDPLSTPIAAGSRKRSRSETTNTSATMPSSKKQRIQPAKKSVCFNNMLEVCFVDYISNEDAPNVWYSKEDFRGSKRRDHVLLQSSPISDSFGEALVDVLEATTNPSTILKQQSRAEVAESPFRGLERDLFPCFRQRKRQVVANVLKSQASIQAWRAANPEKSADHTVLMLASHCRKLAQPSQRFARLLAQADVLAAM